MTDCDSTGLRIQGADNTARRNRLERNTDNGILLIVSGDGSSGNRLENNVCRWNEGEGIENGGTETVFSNNVITGNRLDVTNRNDLGASLLDGGGNVFRTGGPDTPPQVLR